MRRKSIASADSLDPDEVERYPVTEGDTVIYKGNGLAAALLGGALTAAGAGGSWYLLKPEPIPEPPPPIVDTTTTVTGYRLDFPNE